MTAGTVVVLEVAIRVVVLAAVFWIAARKHDRITFAKRWAPPVVGLVFAVLGTALYWLLVPVLSLATLGVGRFAMPLVVNLLLLAATARIFRARAWFAIDGVFALVWLATFVTLADGALWLALDYLPKRV
jgi:hypothetical protein